MSRREASTDVESVEPGRRGRADIQTLDTGVDRPTAAPTDEATKRLGRPFYLDRHRAVGLVGGESGEA